MSVPLLQLSPGDTESLSALADEFRTSVVGNDLQLGYTRSQAENAQTADRLQAGDRGRVTTGNNEEVWLHHPGDPTDPDATDAQVHAGVGAFEPDQRSYQQTVRLSDNETEAPPRTDAYEWYYGSGVDLTAETVNQFITVPDRAKNITISVDDPDADYHVEVHFRTGPEGDGQTITKRGAAESSDYSGSGPSDVFAITSIASPYVEVRIIDDSAASSNTVDYSIYAR